MEFYTSFHCSVSPVFLSGHWCSLLPYTHGFERYLSSPEKIWNGLLRFWTEISLSWSWCYEVKFVSCCVLHEEFLPFCNVWYTCLIKYHSNVSIFGNISALCFFGLVISFVSAIEYQTNNDDNYDKADGSYHPCK